MAERHELVEQFVLERLELCDLGGDGLVLARHGIGVALCLTVLVFGQRRLGYQRAQSGLVGLGTLLFALFLAHLGFHAQGTETIAGVCQSALDSDPGHGGSLEGAGDLPVRSKSTPGSGANKETRKARSVRRPPALATLAALVLASSVSCGASGGGACGPITRDALDPSSLTHVLPGAPAPSYLADPPTSGAHQPTPPIQGVQSRPVAPQIQVGILEEGRVLVQYQGLDTTAIAKIRGLVSPKVVVAPATALPGDARVVVTAWVTRQSCTALDLPKLRTFISTRSGKGPGRP